MQYSRSEIRYNHEKLRIFITVHSDVPGDHDDYIYLASAQSHWKGGWPAFIKKNGCRAIYRSLKQDVRYKRELAKWGLTDEQMKQRLMRWRQRAVRDGLRHTVEY